MNNFLADNNTSPEIIFPITFDGSYTQTYGGMEYIIYAECGGTMPPSMIGISQWLGWNKGDFSNCKQIC